MSTYSGYMNVYNGYGAAITSVYATHTASSSSPEPLNSAELGSGAAAIGISITAYSDQDDNWTLSFIDAAGHKKTVTFNDCSFKSEDIGGTVVFNISQQGVKLSFPESDDNFTEY